MNTDSQLLTEKAFANTTNGNSRYDVITSRILKKKIVASVYIPLTEPSSKFWYRYRP